MIYIELGYNLILLSALAIILRFIDDKFPRNILPLKIVYGFLFGLIAIIGMTRPLFLTDGLFLDGRSIVLSLAALFFGPITALIAGCMVIIAQIILNGTGIPIGILIVSASIIIGTIFHFMYRKGIEEINCFKLLFMGFTLHAVILLLLFIIHYPASVTIVRTIGITFILSFPLTTVIVGKIFSFQQKNLCIPKKLNSNTSTTEKEHIDDALANSEVRYRRLFESAKDGILILDAETGRIVDVNPFLIELLGYSKESFIEKEIWEIGFFKDIAANKDKFLELQENEYVRYEDLPLETVHGKKINVEFVSNVYFVNHHKVIQCNIRDITTRKRIENELREKEVQYHNLANSGIALVWTSGTDKLCNYFNEPWLKFTGRTIEQELGNGWTEGVHPDDLENCFNTFVSAFDKRQSFDMEYRLLNANGIYKWLRDLGSPNYDSNGDFIGYIGHCFDITEHKQIEKALLENEVKFRKLTETASDAIISIDSFGNVTSWNDSAEDVFGYSYEEIIGKNINLFLSQKYTSFYESELVKIFSEEKSRNNCKTININGIRKDKTLFPIELSISSWELDGLLYYTAIIRDITERMKNEQELKVYQNHLEDLVNARTKELDRVNESLRNEVEKEKEFELKLQESLGKEKDLNEMKSRFISTTSHEFRTPLTAVLSSTEMLQRFDKTWTADKKNEHFDRITRSVIYLTKLLDDVLTISKTETGKISFIPEIVDLHKIAKECVQDAKTLLKINHKMEMRYKPMQSEFFLDPKLIRFILNNLLSNAVKYSPQGGKIELNITDNNKNLFIEVIDEGIGIVSDDIQKIYDSFYRSKNVVGVAGTGLGLSIVKRAVDLHGGDISVDSQINKGSKFIVRIPFSK